MHDARMANPPDQDKRRAKVAMFSASAAVDSSMAKWPLFVHCCHCRCCQRELSAAFALNAMIETERVVLLQGAPHKRRAAVATFNKFTMRTKGRPHGSISSP